MSEDALPGAAELLVRGDGALVAVVSGANMSFDSLRFVAERAALA